jgi:hypothetical protein
VIRARLGTLWLGRNSGTSGDCKLTRPAPYFQDAVFKTLVVEVLPSVIFQSLSLKPTVAAYPRAALRVLVACLAHENSSDWCRRYSSVPAAAVEATGAGNVLSPRPLRVAVGPTRRARSGNDPFGGFC